MDKLYTEKLLQYRNHLQGNLFLEITHKAQCLKSEERKVNIWMKGWWIGVTFTTVFPLEDGPNCEPCGFHVLRILAKIDPYVETFPKFYTHILSLCVAASNTFSKIAGLHYNPFNIGLNIRSRERVHLIYFWLRNNLNYEWR